MRKVILMIVLSAVSSNAAAEWEPAMYNKGNTKITYVDAATIRKAGNKVKMWSLTDFKTAEYYGQKPYMSQKDQREYDCKEKRMRLLFASIHIGNMGRGEVISEANTQNWEPVPPGTIGEALWKIACGILKPH